MKIVFTVILIAVMSHGLAAGSINLSWKDNSDNEAGFDVQRSHDDGQTWLTLGPADAGDPLARPPVARKGTVGADIRIFTDDDFPTNERCIYRVTAFNLFGNSGFSNRVEIFTATPNAPTGLASTVIASVSLVMIALLAIFLFFNKPHKHGG